MQNVFIVYRAAHLSRGVYVGLTRMGLSARKGAHLSAARRGSKIPFHQALRSRPCGWEWTILFVSLDGEEAGRREAEEILRQGATLNILTGGCGGGNWPDGYPLGGVKNKGRKMPPEFVRWITNFHRTRPRKRRYDREAMVRLRAEGKTIVSVANILNCDPALVSRVVNGKYKR